MVDLEALKGIIENSGVKISVLAEKSGVSRMTFYKKLKGETEFKVSEIVGLCNALRLTNAERDSIFFS